MAGYVEMRVLDFVCKGAQPGWVSEVLKQSIAVALICIHGDFIGVGALRAFLI